MSYPEYRKAPPGRQLKAARLSFIIFFAGILVVGAGKFFTWSPMAIVALPALFYVLNGLHRGTIFTLLFVPVHIITNILYAPHECSLALTLTAYIIQIPLTFTLQYRKEQSEKTLHKQIYYDPLTGLPNRYRLLQDLTRAEIPILFLINIDDFKEINDVFSPKAGDTILYELSILLGNITSEEPCTLYRLTADEYALLFDNKRIALSRAHLSRVAENICEKAAAATFALNSSEIRLRVTIGIGDSRIESSDNLLAQADMALKTAKSGHKSFLFFTQTIDTRKNYKKNIQSLRILTDALENGRIVPYFMPISNSATGVIESYECLARLVDSENRVYPPFFFLEIAKKARLYSQVTRMVFQKAVEYFKNRPYMFTVNISMEDIDNPETVSYFLEVLEVTPEVRGRLIFEILESESINNYPQVVTFIQLVKTYECRIAIDDFGSGYSNFEHIPRLRVDYIKINGALIRNITKNSESRFIVENINSFARGLGIQTIAEYVEDDTIRDELRSMQVDYLQGYLIGEPGETIK